MEMSGPLDESENSIFSFFKNVGSNLSQFYGQSLNHKNLLLQAGQQYAYVNLHKWMLERLEAGRMVTVPEILNYLQCVVKVSDGGPDEGQSAGGSGHASEGQSAGGSGHASDVATAPSSPHEAGPNQTNYLDMKMDFTSDRS